MPVSNKYTITGYTTGGWDVVDTATSLKVAKRLARETMGGFSGHSSARCCIQFNGVTILAWSGTTAGKWRRVCI